MTSGLGIPRSKSGTGYCQGSGRARAATRVEGKRTGYQAFFNPWIGRVHVGSGHGDVLRLLVMVMRMAYR